MARLVHRFHDLSIRWKLLGAFGLVLLLVAAQSAFVYRSTLQSRDADAWVEHTLRVIDLIDGTTAALIDEQTSYRGFLLTGDESSLAPYAAGQATYAADLRELRAITGDNPAQQARWDQLATLVDQWQQEIITPGIALRRQVEAGTADPIDVQTFAQTAGGEARFNAIRHILADANADEHALLEGRNHHAAAARRQLRQVVLVGTAIACLLAIALALIASQVIATSWRRMAIVSERVAAGDLTQRVDLRRTDEIGRTAAAFDRMVRQLQDVVEKLEISIGQARRSEARSRAVLDAAREGMVLISAEGEILAANQRFVELFDSSLDAIVGRAVGDFRQELERIFADPGQLDRLLGIVANPDQRVTEFMRQAYPIPRELELVSVPALDGFDASIARVFSFRDVTAEREVDRMKTEFISLVSHELRTPLTSIKGYVDLVMDGEAGELDPLQLEFLEIVHNNVDRLVGLINDLLDISRIEAGKIELKPSPLQLGQIVRGVAMSFRPQFEEKRQTLEIDIPATLPAVLADPDRLTQILANLVSNAHKYAPAGGATTIRARAEDGAVRVAVTDTGIGMTQDDLGKLFTKFFRAANRTTQEVGGTGLGLVITRSLVQMHGSDLDVSSAPGRGSEFSFVLPAATTAGLPAAAASGRARHGCVLVIEDEGDIAALIRRYLERSGHDVLTAGTGADGLLLAREDRPDLITLDLELPDINGLAVLDALRRDPATAGIPIIVLTVHPDDGEWRRRGADDFFAKPVPERALLDRVDSLLAVGHERAAEGLAAAGR